MTDFDLITRLKGVPVPDRPDEYWEDFPSRVRVQLRREAFAFAPRGAWRPRLAWLVGSALAVALAVVCLEFRVPQTVSQSVVQKHRQFHAQLARLDNGLHKLMLNTDGMGYLLAESN
jgi:hypothetical protein